MNKVILQSLLLVMVIALCGSGFFIGQRLLALPFRATNDTLHERDADLTLDFLIPAGTYIDEKMTIREVAEIRLKKTVPFYEEAMESLLGLIPRPYRYLASLLVFFFFVFSFLAFFRVFTFMGYGRSLRISLLMGGLIYFFLPDFLPGKRDDIILTAAPAFLILFRLFYVRGKRRKGRSEKKEKLPLPKSPQKRP